MEIAGHVSRQMLSRYRHIRTEAKRRHWRKCSGTREAARERLKQARQQEDAKPNCR